MPTIAQLKHELLHPRPRYLSAYLLAMADLRGFKSRQRINRICRGYSSALHWHFFRRTIAKYQPKTILMLGAYYGRDMAYLNHFAPEATIVGVDYFSPFVGVDWPPELRGKSWREVGLGDAPTIEKTISNLTKAINIQRMMLHQCSAEKFMRQTKTRFDLIYIDIEHDTETTRKTIVQASRLLTSSGILAGDDYGYLPVRKAVDELLEPEVTGDWIWLARPGTVLQRTKTIPGD